MLRWVLVGCGGFVGSVARYALSGIVQRWADTAFPLGTLAVNVAGSFILGLVAALALERNLIGPETRLLLAVGFCGGFTTMSTLSYETLALLREAGYGAALGNVTLSIVACLTAVWLGDALGRLL